MQTAAKKSRRAGALRCDHPGCGQVLSRPDSLIRHKRDKHPDAADAIECVTCSKRFFSKAALTQHRQQNKCRIDLGLPSATPAGRLSDAVAPATTPDAISPWSSSTSSLGLSPSLLSLSSLSNSAATSSPVTSRPAVRLTDEAIDAGVADFLHWLSQPAANRDERGLKNSRVLTETQRKDQLSQLRRLFYLAEQHFPAAFAQGVSIAVVVEDAVVQRIQEHLENHRERRARKRSHDAQGGSGLGAGARYKVFLQMKKILVFMSSKNRRQTGLDHGPDQFTSWQRVLTLCDDANRERGAEENDRLMFDDRSEDIMTREEQHACLAACSRQLQQLRMVPLLQWTRGQHRSFEAHLVTALFLVLAGPRSQILARMKVDSTLLRPGQPGNQSPPGQFEVQIRSRETKGKEKGALLSVPAEYSDHLAFFIESFLPAGWTGHVWLQGNGQPRAQFAVFTRLVTQSALGRPINPHQFRHSEVTARNESEGAALAEVQGNSVGVQNRFYRVQQLRAAQQRFATEMMEGARAVEEQCGGEVVVVSRAAVERREV